jgi:hypothetical protein
MSSFSWMASQGITEYHVDHVFGRNSDIGNSFDIVATDGIYKMPQFSSPEFLRIKAGNINDDIAGSGARIIRIVGSDNSNSVTIELVPTAGESAGASSVNLFTRLQRFEVFESGTFATNGVFSHVGDICVETLGGAQWGCIDATDIARGESQIGAFTVPTIIPSPTRGPNTKIKGALITGYTLTVDSGKSSDFLIMQRPNGNSVGAPYSAFKVLREHLQVVDLISPPLSIPLGPFPPGTDILVYAKAVTSAAVSIDLEVALLL